MTFSVKGLSKTGSDITALNAVKLVYRGRDKPVEQKELKVNERKEVKPLVLNQPVKEFKADVLFEDFESDLYSGGWMTKMAGFGYRP